MIKGHSVPASVCTASLWSSACSRAGALPQELPALGWGLCHHHLPHLCGLVLPDAHPGGHRGRLVARQVQVSGGRWGQSVLSWQVPSVYGWSFEPASILSLWSDVRLSSPAGLLFTCQSSTLWDRWSWPSAPSTTSPTQTGMANRTTWPSTCKPSPNKADEKAPLVLHQAWLTASAALPFFSALSMLGLILIALGTGGIKPCVAAFGGDQFLDHQVRRFT